MAHTIHYICKYTPLELFAAMGAECVYANHMPDGFGISEAVIGSNICGFGKSLIDLVSSGGVHELIMTSCCDTIRSVYDNLQKSGKPDFLFYLDIPHAESGCTKTQLSYQLKQLVRAYSAYSGNCFDRNKFMEAMKLSHAQQVRPNSPYISILGGRAGIELHKEALKEMPLPVHNDTCVAGRSVGESLPDPSLSFDGLMDWYAGELLSQLPCMRMIDREGRKRLYNDPNLRGIIYHTIRFCDFYNFEYSEIKSHVDVPMLKIETDYTTGSSGQLLTRLQAFAEEIRSTYSDTPQIFKGNRSGGSAMNKQNFTYVAGIDSGSASTDVVILDKDRNYVAGIVLPTGAGAVISAEKALEAALQEAGLSRSDIGRVVTTGYGRTSIGNSDRSITEITCHARGAHFLDPSVRTVIDIGGQDSKVITLDSTGKVTNFVMNDKCAAGTGRFLDMMARTMEMTLDDMSLRGLTYKEDITISSTCTVFAESEVVSLIAENKDVDDIVHGLDKSVAAKTATLVARAGGSGPFMMTGGVSKNKGLVKALSEKLGQKLIISDKAQLCGALGAALYALD